MKNQLEHSDIYNNLAAETPDPNLFYIYSEIGFTNQLPLYKYKSFVESNNEYTSDRHTKLLQDSIVVIDDKKSTGSMSTIDKNGEIKVVLNESGEAITTISDNGKKTVTLLADCDSSIMKDSHEVKMAVLREYRIKDKYL